MKGMKYVALLRGINVGGNNTVSMQELKKVFEGLGFQNVSTYINSGNVIFESKNKIDIADLTKKINAGIKKELALEIKTLVKDSKQIKSIYNKIPKEWANDPDQRTDVLFLWEEYDKKKSLELIKINPDVDTLKYVSGAIIWNLKKSDYKKSKMNKFIGTVVYNHMTARNMNTTKKLSELLSKKTKE